MVLGKAYLVFCKIHLPREKRRNTKQDQRKQTSEQMPPCIRSLCTREKRNMYIYVLWLTTRGGDRQKHLLRGEAELGCGMRTVGQFRCDDDCHIVLGR